MKLPVIFSVLAAFASLSANAAEVRGARVNANDATLQVDISYGGGCGNKSFKLEVSPEWAYTSPTQGTARIIESGFDACEAIVSKTLSFSLKAEGLARPSLRAATLTIYGEDDSSAEVTLPYEL
ncbi:MAG: hypothetical protein EOP11_12250 [Proteobacteria bacterium]|nr:MAG: hypothetical protein EOP11_12250 [Pseudomonadota bacterium]